MLLVVLMVRLGWGYLRPAEGRQVLLRHMIGAYNSEPLQIALTMIHSS